MLSRQDYNIVEIEMILNYFPHSVWATEEDMRPLRDGFYSPLHSTVIQNIQTISNRQFISLFQGMALSGPKIFG